MPPWVSYTLIRFGLFAVIFAGLLLMRVDWLWAAISAAVAGFCVAYIFFRRQRDEIALQLAARRRAEAETRSDEAAEDVDDDPRPAAG